MVNVSAYVLIISPFLSTASITVTLSTSGGAQIAGQDYTLTCQVTGGGTMTPTYQWFRGTSVLTDETSMSLSFSPLREIDSGDYTCEGTRSSIAVTSDPITITVMGKLTHGRRVVTCACIIHRSSIVSSYKDMFLTSRVCQAPIL